MGEANSSQGLAPHTPDRRLSRLLFLCLIAPVRSWARPSTERLRTSKPERKALYKALPSRLRICCISSQTFPMTDYSTAIFGLIAFTGVVSAAVVYILAQPSDLPVVKKAKAAQN